MDVGGRAKQDARAVEVRRDESTLLSDQWRRIPGMDSIEHGVTVVTAITEVRYITKINN